VTWCRPTLPNLIDLETVRLATGARVRAPQISLVAGLAAFTLARTQTGPVRFADAHLPTGVRLRYADGNPAFVYRLLRIRSLYRYERP
jgi:hypothetical protein